MKEIYLNRIGDQISNHLLELVNVNMQINIFQNV